jgi:hypothetical protein
VRRQRFKFEHHPGTRPPVHDESELAKEKKQAHRNPGIIEAKK